MNERQTDAAFPVFAVTVDVVALMLRDDQLSVLLIKRREEPFKGRWSLPGGFVRRGPEQPDESLDDAARREFVEETGIELDAAYIAQLGAYGDPGRDPRGNVVTVAYLAVSADEQPTEGGRRRRGTRAGCTSAPWSRRARARSPSTTIGSSPTPCSAPPSSSSRPRSESPSARTGSPSPTCAASTRTSGTCRGTRWTPATSTIA